jgi:hypothetical protein
MSHDDDIGSSYHLAAVAGHDHNFYYVTRVLEVYNLNAAAESRINQRAIDSLNRQRD